MACLFLIDIVRFVEDRVEIKRVNYSFDILIYF